MMNSTQTTLFELIKAKTGVNPQLNSSLEMLQLDSLAMAELTCEIEQTFKIRGGDDITFVTDMTELLNYIEDRL